MDELDLYRPSYAAVKRILDEVNSMHSKGGKTEATKIIEETLYECIINWLNWDFTYQSSPSFYRVGLKVAKRILEWMKALDGKAGAARLEIRSIAGLMRILMLLNRQYTPSVSPGKMKTFPSFMRAYRHYEFQIHAEGHTHQPLQEEPNIKTKYSSTYINLGSWRDQIVLRKGSRSKYRRSGVLRAFFILDVVNDDRSTQEESPRTFDYFVQDVMHWGDFKDSMNKNGRSEPKT